MQKQPNSIWNWNLFIVIRVTNLLMMMAQVKEEAGSMKRVAAGVSECLSLKEKTGQWSQEENSCSQVAGETIFKWKFLMQVDLMEPPENELPAPLMPQPLKMATGRQLI